MNFWRWVEGSVTVTVTGADIPGSLEGLRKQGIILWDITQPDELTLRFSCGPGDLGIIEHQCRKRGDAFSRGQRRGLYFRGKTLLKRPVLVAGILLFMALTLWLPTRVLFFQVEGNRDVPARLILETAADCGIRLGASRRQVRSEKMKNALLEAMPELKWAGINTTGCTAVIRVRERDQPANVPPSYGVSSIAAVRDSLVTSCTATWGKLLCAPGQAVRQGQILISGYNDLGICIQAGRAAGEIFGRTSREIRAVAPMEVIVRGERTGESRRYHLILGKKRINFLKDSGIWDATCGRMYKAYYITLPGGFCLPVGIGVETLTHWDLTAGTLPEEEMEDALSGFAEREIRNRMIAGQILSRKISVIREEDRCVLSGRFFCEEMIGRVITEEIGATNGKTD